MKLDEAIQIIMSAPYIFTEDEIASFEFKVDDKIPYNTFKPNDNIKDSLIIDILLGRHACSTLQECYYYRWYIIPQKELLYSKLDLVRFIIRQQSQAELLYRKLDLTRFIIKQAAPVPKDLLVPDIFTEKLYNAIAKGLFWELPRETQIFVVNTLFGKQYHDANNSPKEDLNDNYSVYSGDSLFSHAALIEHMYTYSKERKFEHYAKMYKNKPLRNKLKGVSPYKLFETILDIEQTKDYKKLYNLKIPLYIPLNIYSYNFKYRWSFLEEILNDNQYKAYELFKEHHDYRLLSDVNNKIYPTIEYIQNKIQQLGKTENLRKIKKGMKNIDRLIKSHEHWRNSKMTIQEYDNFIRSLNNI